MGQDPRSHAVTGQWHLPIHDYSLSEIQGMIQIAVPQQTDETSCGGHRLAHVSKFMSAFWSLGPSSNCDGDYDQAYVNAYLSRLSDAIANRRRKDGNWRSFHINFAGIPANCTSYLQPVDTHLAYSFKARPRGQEAVAFRQGVDAALFSAIHGARILSHRMEFICQQVLNW